ncbi:MAG: uracil-DNA glycosylase [Elusimicrobiota bacterium]
MLRLTRDLRILTGIPGELELNFSSAVAQPEQRSSSSDKPAALEALAREIKSCARCPLGRSRLQAVPGVGNPNARVVFIGEGPGFAEDHKGEPFVGPAGKLLDKILAAISLSRETVYIANVVKCHPMKDPSNPESRGNDRPPTPEEAQACRSFLDRQLRVIEPEVIVTLGAVALKSLAPNVGMLSAVRGRWLSYEPPQQDNGRAIKMLPTYHPAALLRNPALKKDVWTDMKALKKELGAGENR